MAAHAVGLEVNVTEGPFLIYFTINPKYDCLNDPDSCRGTVLVPVNRPYCTITVTDNQTHQIVAEDGYAPGVQFAETDRSIDNLRGPDSTASPSTAILSTSPSRLQTGSAPQTGTVLTSQTDHVSRAAVPEEMQRYGP